MLKDYFQPAFLLLIALFIAGCATQPRESQENLDARQLWAEQQASNAGLESWNIRGKIGVKTGKKGGSATLKWNYIPDDQDIELYGPFGGGRVKISADANSAVLRDNKGRVIEGDSPGEVLYKRLGWQVPFNDLVLWSRGLHSDTATDITIDNQGRLKSLNQGDWHVEYQEYRQVDDLILPRKLVITSLPGKMELYDDDGNYIGDELSVKVILKRWRNLSAG